MRIVNAEHEMKRIQFAEKAARYFALHPECYSFSDVDLSPGCLLAMRCELDDDCVLVLKLDDYFEPTKYQNIISVKRRVDQAGQGADHTVATTFRIKPIDQSTIKVGDTVRLVGSRTITEWPDSILESILEAGKDYKVIEVNNKDNKTLNVRIACNFKGGFWVYGEDLVLVESAHGEKL